MLEREKPRMNVLAGQAGEEGDITEDQAAGNGDYCSRRLLRITFALTPSTSARHFLYAGLRRF
jgi:hypothetical protein